MTRREEILQYILIGASFFLAAMALAFLLGKSVDTEMDNNLLRLDSQLTPAQRAEIMRGEK